MSIPEFSAGVSSENLWIIWKTMIESRGCFCCYYGGGLSVEPARGGRRVRKIGSPFHPLPAPAGMDGGGSYHRLRRHLHRHLCFLLLQQPDGRDDSGRCDQSRGLCLRGLQQSEDRRADRLRLRSRIRLDTGDPRRCALRLHCAEKRDDSGKHHEYRRPCFLCMQQPDRRLLQRHAGPVGRHRQGQQQRSPDERGAAYARKRSA